jgi:hypothetical protein
VERRAGMTRVLPPPIWLARSGRVDLPDVVRGLTQQRRDDQVPRASLEVRLSVVTASTADSGEHGRAACVAALQGDGRPLNPRAYRRSGAARPVADEPGPEPGTTDQPTPRAANHQNWQLLRRVRPSSDVELVRKQIAAPVWSSTRHGTGLAGQATVNDRSPAPDSRNLRRTSMHRRRR